MPTPTDQATIDADVVDAAVMAGVHELILRLPQWL